MKNGTCKSRGHWGQQRSIEDQIDHLGIYFQPFFNRINHYINIYGLFFCLSEPNYLSHLEIADPVLANF